MPVWESAPYLNNLTVTRVKLEGLDPAPKGTLEIAVTFEVDTYCSLSIKAIDRGSEKQIFVDSQESESPLSKEIVKQLLDEAEQNREEDQKKREQIENELKEAQEKAAIRRQEEEKR